MGCRGERVPQEDHQGDQLRRVATFFMLLSMIGLALADQNSAFQDGKGLGAAKNQGVFDSINTGTASDKIPAYGATPSETQYYQGGKGQLAGPGTEKVQSCGSYTPGPDKIANQECEAVNFLARNPQVRPQFNITKNDPMIIGAKNARNSAESFFQAIGIDGGAGSSSQCTTRTETTPAQYTTETCSSLKEVGEQQCTMGRVVNIDYDANFQCEETVNAYENLKCRRGFSPQFGIETSTKTYTPSFGSEVPPWTSRTFNTSIDIDQNASSITATLTKYQVDNYGQLWINGTKVYENRLSTFPYDIRNSSYGCETSYDADYGYFYSCGLMVNGDTYQMWDDGCNWGCRGVSPNLDISAYFRKGSNTITLVCVNANSIGPCYATINVTEQKTVVTGSIVQNGCETLEARAR